MLVIGTVCVHAHEYKSKIKYHRTVPCTQRRYSFVHCAQYVHHLNKWNYNFSLSRIVWCSISFFPILCVTKCILLFLSFFRAHLHIFNASALLMHTNLCVCVCAARSQELNTVSFSSSIDFIACVALATITIITSEFTFSVNWTNAYTHKLQCRTIATSNLPESHQQCNDTTQSIINIMCSAGFTNNWCSWCMYISNYMNWRNQNHSDW